MNAPFNGDFEVTQTQTGSVNDASHHDGLDLVPFDDDCVYSTSDGYVIHSGWENPNDHSQGFGLYVAVQDSNNKIRYYGHLSKIFVELGEKVQVTTPLGIVGSTGYSTGIHLHYCIRENFSSGNALNVSEISGIPNQVGVYNDGYIPSGNITTQTDDTTLMYPLDSIKDITFNNGYLVIKFK